RKAQVDWTETSVRIEERVTSKQLCITQGFIAGTNDGWMTTLGREGSDYSAAIFGKCLKAKEVVFWKDVPGIMNADPKLFPGARKFDYLSYQEATEMTYYGAKVIHPKTLKPLAIANIPLTVKSFLNSKGVGSCISEEQEHETIPTYVFRYGQALVTLKSRENEFTSKKILIKVFSELEDLGIELNIMQRSALTFSFSVDATEEILLEIRSRFESDFKVYYNNQLHLATVKNFTKEALDLLPDSQEIYLEQITRHNYQRLYSPK
ncbi:MAG: aspartate kinase, partial [Bacteroidota bacterium]